MKCSNIDRGCTWNGTVSTLADHLDSCGYTMIPCPNECASEDAADDPDDEDCCSNDSETLLVQRMNLRNHLTNFCPNRLQNCGTCGERNKYVYINGEHIKNCPMKITECSNNDCSATFKRKDEDEHLDACEYMTVACEYDDIGCPVKKMRREMPHHAKNDSKHHISCALKKIKDLKETISKLNDDISAFEDQHTKVLVKDMYLTFRVTGFEAIRANNRIYRSNPFYLLNKDGYKICICIHTNSDKHGEVRVGISWLKTAMKMQNNFRLKVELLNQTRDSHEYHAYLHLKRERFMGLIPNDVKLIPNHELYSKHDVTLCDTLYLRVSIAPLNKQWLTSTHEVDHVISPNIHASDI